MNAFVLSKGAQAWTAEDALPGRKISLPQSSKTSVTPQVGTVLWVQMQTPS